MLPAVVGDQLRSPVRGNAADVWFLRDWLYFTGRRTAMDLVNLRSGDAWFNPFTSLIGLESLGGSRELSLAIPVIEEPQMARYSVLFHEVTHLWEMRMSSLGSLLSIAAARAWKQWHAAPGQPVELGERTSHLTGTWLPILEGLALYAELDFSGDEDRDVIHSPVLKVVHFTAPAMRGVPDEQVFLHSRLSRIVEHRLLAQLLIEPTVRPEERAYFTGYLYVKALAAQLGGLCPALAPPARMLPLLIRILCDHPVIARSQRTECSTEELLGAVHDTAVSLDSSLLHKIAKWVEQSDPQEVVWRFDYLDIAKSRNAGDLVFDGDDRPDLHEFVSNDIIPSLNLLKTAGSFYLPVWKSGVLQSIDESSLTLRQNSEDVKYVLLSAVDFERMKRGGPGIKLAHRVREAMLDILRKAIGREVTVALYIDMASGDPGMAFWVDDEYAFASPYSLLQFGRGADAVKQFSDNLRRGLSLSPAVRSKFGKAIRSSAALGRAAVDASRWHLAKLISSPSECDRVLEHKLAAVENGRFSSEMYECWVPPVPLQIERMPEPVAIAADRIFDFPGFIGGAAKPRLADLIPAFSIKLN
jgi:hypothetical protein